MLETRRLQEGDFVALTQQPNGVLIKQSMNWRMNVHHAAAKQIEAIPQIKQHSMGTVREFKQGI